MAANALNAERHAKLPTIAIIGTAALVLYAEQKTPLRQAKAIHGMSAVAAKNVERPHQTPMPIILGS
jgi:hypothetical protein